MYSSNGSLSFGATSTDGVESTFLAARMLHLPLPFTQISYLTFS
jgi:hypothetical protein